VRLSARQNGRMDAGRAVTVEAVGKPARVLLRSLTQLYLHDLSAVEGWEVDDAGSFGEDDLDGCWTEPRRHPFVIRVESSVAGFAVVDEGSDVTCDPDVFDMAEFFVLRRWRRQGVGREAFRLLLARFPGQWAVRPFPGYAPGEQFWQQVCGELAAGPVQLRSFHRQGKTFPMYAFAAS
jgi:predicted acetyltransferase